MATWLPFVAWMLLGWGLSKRFQCCSKLVAYIAEDFIVRTGPGLLRGAHLKELIQKSTQATPHSFNIGQPISTTNLTFHCKALSQQSANRLSARVLGADKVPGNFFSFCFKRWTTSEARLLKTFDYNHT